MVSVVVVTYNRRKDVIQCINSLFTQVHKPRELIVIDNCSTDDTFKNLSLRFGSAIRILRLDKPVTVGKARDLGLKMAKNDIVAFTDDDCVVHEQWLSELVKGFIKDSVACVSGKTLPLLLGEGLKLPRSNLVISKLGITDYLGDRVLTIKFPRGANFALKRDVAIRIGGFRHDLGKSKNIPLFNDEVDIGYRLRKSGFNILYVPSAVVYHKIAPSQMRFPFFLKRFFYQGVSDYKMKRRRFNCLGLLTFLARATRDMLRSILKRDTTYFYQAVERLGIIYAFFSRRFD